MGSIQVFFGKRVHRNLQGGRVPVAHGSQAGALCRRARIDEEGGRAPLAGDESRADTTLLETKKTEKRKKGLSNAWRSAWRRCVLPRSVRRFLRFCRAYNSGTTRQKKRSCLIDTVRVLLGTSASLLVTSALLVVTMFAIRNKCLTTSNKRNDHV